MTKTYAHTILKHFERVKVVHNKKNSIDDIWAQMNAGMKATSAQKPVASQKQADDMGLTGWLGTSATPKPTEVKQTHGFKVRRLEDLEADAAAEAEAQRKDASSNAQSQAKRPRSGLEDVLDIVRGGPKSQVMHATREKWTEYKKDEAVDDELETYKRGKDRYTDKVAFLARSDVREWEFEQKGRKGRR